MPGDPKECRRHAARCAELARTARTQQLKATLLEMSANWIKIADDLERTKVLLDEENVDFKKQLRGRFNSVRVSNILLRIGHDKSRRVSPTRQGR